MQGGSETSPVEAPMSTRSALGLLLLFATACDKGDAGKNDELPQGLRGNYGQKAEQAQLPTIGLEVDAHALRIGELTVTILQGKADAGGDSQVDKAEARWEKTDKAKLCKGTVSRQGDVLLVKLFQEDSDEHCEATLEGEWKAWTRTEALPERMLGTFGADARRFDADIGVRVEPKRIAFTDGGQEVAVSEVVQWVGKPDQAIVRDATFGGYKCAGSLVRGDESLEVTLAPIPGSPEGAVCPHGKGVRWTTDAAHLPKKKTSNGKVDIEPSGEKLVLVAKDIGLRCEQAVLRTSTRTVTESQSDGLGVPGGALLVLEPAQPTGGTEACRQRLRNVAQTECTEQTGAPCSPDELQAYADEALQCPRQIAIGEPSGGGHKAALMPQAPTLLACWDMTGQFK
jgi:hypothetical protein